MERKYIASLVVSKEDVLDLLGQMNAEDLLETIQQADLNMADWEFTESLYMHLSSEMKKLKEEENKCHLQ